MESLVTPSAGFWRGKRVLVTGHTGFKGGWLAIWLQRLGAQVAGIALMEKPGAVRTAQVGYREVSGVSASSSLSRARAR